MALEPIIATALQVSLLAAISNVLAQFLAAYQANGVYAVNWIPVLQFVLYTFLTTPHNYLWQEFLETTFPAHPSAASTTSTDAKTTTSSAKEDNGKENSSSPAKPRLSVKNTMTKLLLDQTIGAAVNTLIYSVFTHSLRAAMAGTPPIYSVAKAAAHWASPGAIEFSRVDARRVWDAAGAEFWGLMVAGWKFWPLVSAVNFSLIKTVGGRNLVGGCAGLLWGIYLSLKGE